MFNGWKTYIGLIIAAVPTIARTFGYDVSDQFEHQALEIAELAVTFIGLGVALYGRMKAEVPGWLAKKSQ